MQIEFSFISQIQIANFHATLTKSKQIFDEKKKKIDEEVNILPPAHHT
jgi:hypothetical protein